MVVVGRVFRQYGPQMCLGDDKCLVQALRADGADDALRDGVGIRRLRWCLDDREPFGREDGVEARRELPVPIADEEAEGLALSPL